MHKIVKMNPQIHEDTHYFQKPFNFLQQKILTPMSEEPYLFPCLQWTLFSSSSLSSMSVDIFFMDGY